MIDTLHVRIPIARIREHRARFRRLWSLLAIGSGVVFAQVIAIEVIGSRGGRFETSRVWGELPWAIDVALLFALVVAQLASGTGLVVGIVRWWEVLRLRGSAEDIGLVIERDRVTVSRDERVVHDRARVLAVDAFPDWLRVTIEDATKFALPLDGSERAAVIDALRGAGVAVVERGSFARLVVVALLGATTEHVGLHVVTHVVAIAVTVLVLAAPLVALELAGPLACVAVVAVMAAAVVALAVARSRPR